MFTVLAPASMAASTTCARNSSSVREASSGENSTSSHNSRAIFTPSMAVRRISSWAMLSLYWRWMALVARKTWMRCWGAARSAFAASSMSSRLLRARPQMMAPGTSRATALTDSQSPREAAGNPASMTSTPSSASERATRSFSGWVMLQPGDCSPSRRVVSKINTLSGLGVIAVSLSQRILTLRSLLAQPGHAGAQLATDFLDLAILVFLEHPLIVLAAGGAFLDPLLGELARLHFLQNLAHDVLDAVVDDSLTTSEVAVLGGVADELVHLGEASFMEKVDDELQLMEALVVRDLRLIAGLDQRLKALHHELGGAAAQHCLLSEEIRLCLFSERSLQNAAARAADTMRVGEGLSMRLAARILRDRDQTRYATAFLVLPAYQAAGALRCNEDDIQILAGFDLFVVDVEAMREQQGGPFLQALLDFLVERLLGEIGHEHRNEVSSSGSIRGLCDFETIFLGLFPARSFLAHPHHDV